jgi:hypothetical protein
MILFKTTPVKTSNPTLSNCVLITRMTGGYSERPKSYLMSLAQPFEVVLAF